ncbi:hypothetical protein [uncultured Clostridium sp.]|uniref:hypothetical protein n=1 Tax=uncultured Clostridium sp. TaxID=59620 RepID=UPI0032169ECB
MKRVMYSISNCYDEAAYLQCNLKQHGYSSKYCFMNPFGYINETNLKGRGMCNNPFYGSVGDAKVLNPNDPRRTSFIHFTREFSEKIGYVNIFL